MVMLAGYGVRRVSEHGLDPAKRWRLQAGWLRDLETGLMRQPVRPPSAARHIRPTNNDRACTNGDFHPLAACRITVAR